MPKSICKPLAELLIGWADRFEQLAPEFIGISSVLGESINAGVAETLASLSVPFEFVQVSATHPLLTSNYDPNQLGVDRWLQILGAVDHKKRQCIVGCGTVSPLTLLTMPHIWVGIFFQASIYSEKP